MKTLALLLSLFSQEWEQSFETADPATQARAASVARLQDEISILNLVNGLYLSKSQSEKIIALAREAGELRDATIRKHANLVRELETALAELKKTLSACGHIPAELERRVQDKELQINGAKHAYADGLRAIEKRLCALLTPAQRRVVDTFNPCIIPPHDLKDPVRAGQAGGEHRDIEDHMETLRNLPDKAWKPVAGALFEMYLSFEEKVLGAFEPEKRKTEMERLTKLVEKARAMSDPDFASEKGTLAIEVIRPITEHQEKGQELTSFYLKASGGLSKPGKYLLNPRLVPLLEAKLEHNCESERKPVDLNTVDGADSCASCGRPAAPRPRVERLGPEPRIEEVTDWLDLSGDAARKVREAVAEAQYDLLTTLSADREDGRNILSEFLRKLLAKEESAGIALLSLKAPGTDKTYFERLAEIKTAAEARMEEAAGAEKFQKYRGADVDPFKIKVGSLRCRK
jgi:hypothetical protein